MWYAFKKLEGEIGVEIRLATVVDMGEMRAVFDYGRAVQLETGNLKQWEEGYPNEVLMRSDIEREAAHVCVDEAGEIVAVFSLFTDPDPTYTEIDGAWLNDEPYATIHRIATNGKVKGVGQYCLKWVQDRFANVRIDTHDDNEPMKYLMKKLDFAYCGVITLENGDPRNAYHYVKA